MKVAVLGAGIAGLWAGNELQKKGYSITVFEQLPEIGGLCRSKKVHDKKFLFDIGGGHIFHSVYKDVLEKIIDTVGKNKVLKHKRDTRIYIYDSFIKYPFENGLNKLPDKVKLECLLGFIYAWHKNGSDIETFFDFKDLIYKKFGKGIADHFMVPYNKKIWCIDPSELGTDWIKNRVPHAPIEDVVKSALGIETEGYKHQSVFYYPQEGAVQSFINAVAEKIKDEIRLNSPVEKIEKINGKWQINGEPFDRVFSTIPLDVFCGLHNSLPSNIIEKAKTLRHLSLLTVLICVKKKDCPPLSWVYLPHDNQGEANRLTFFSNYSQKLCPQEHTSILCEATYMENLTDGQKKQKTKAIVDSMIKLNFVSKKDIIGVYHDWIPYAYILCDKQMADNRDYILNYFAGDKSINFAGRFGSFRYYNMDQVIKQVDDLIKDKF